MATKSVKRQMMEQLASQHVQQALNNIGMEQMQKEFNTWNSQQDAISAFENEFNEWAKANAQPAPQPQAQPKRQAKAQSIPVLNTPDLTDFFKPKTASGKEVNKESAKQINKRAFNEAYARQQQEEQMLSGKSKKETAQTKQAEKTSAVDPEEIIKKYAEAKGISEAQAREEYNKAEATRNQSITAPGKVDQEATDKAKVELQTSKLLDTNKKLFKEEKKDARALAQAELAKFEYGPDKKPILRTPEERQHYADMVALLNKANPVSNALNMAIQQPLNLARTVRDAGRSVGNQLTGLGSAVGDKFGITEGATQRHNERVANADAFINQNDANMDRAQENALVQNPVLSRAGGFAGTTAMYMLTNPLFDALGAGVGLSKAGKFALNQVGQNAQDLALTTIPKLNRYMKDGELSREEKTDLLMGAGVDALQNGLMGGINLHLQNKALKNMGDIEDSIPELTNFDFKPYDVEAGVKVDDPYMKWLAEDVEPAKPQNSIPSPEELKALEAEANTMDDIEDYSDIWRQPEAPKTDIPPVEEDIKLSDAEMNKLLNDIQPEASKSKPKLEIQVIHGKNGTERYHVVERVSDNMTVPVEGAKTYKTIDEANEAVYRLQNAEPEAPKADVTPEAPKATIDTDPGAQRVIDAYKKRERYAQVDNPNLSYEQNENINGNLFLLDEPFYSEDVLQAVGKLMLSVNDPDAFKVMDDYMTLSHTYRTTLDPAIKEQLNDIKASLKTVDKQHRSTIKQLMDFTDIENALTDYKVALNGADAEAVESTKKTLDAARNRLARGQGNDPALKKAFSGSYGTTVGRPAYEYNNKPEIAEDLVQDWIEWDAKNTNKYARAVDNGTPKPVTESAPEAPDKVMAESVRKPKPEAEITEGKWEIEDTPENAPRNTTEELWNELTGGTPKTEPVETTAPVRTQEVNAQGQKLSRLHSTLQNTDKLTDAEKQVYADKNGFWYDPDVERNLADQAKADIETNGLDSIFDKYAKADADPSLFSGADAHKMHTASFDYSRLAREARENGDNALADFYNAKARALELKVREIGTAGGQFNAATAYYARTPQGAVDTAYKLLDKQITDFKSANPKLTDGIDDLADFIESQLKDVDVDGIMTGTDEAAKDNLRKQILNGVSDYLSKSKNKQLKDALGGLTDSDIDQLVADKYARDIAKTLDMFSMGSFGVRQETIDQVMDIFAEAEKYGINSKQYYKLEKQAYALLANDLMDGKSFGDKFNAWRYFAMLSNPLTHVRNNLGNLTNSALTGIKNNLAAAIEEGADRVAKANGADGIQGGRTKAFLNWSTDKNLIEGAAKDFDDNAYRLYKQGGNKWINVGDDINAAAHTWKDQGAGKVLNTLTEGNSKALDVEDIVAGKAKYQTSLAGFLKANGADASIFDATDDASKELLDRARTYALNQANEATFHQNSALAKYFTEHFNGKIGNIAIPFKKTPANILQASFEYSPAGFINVAKKTNAWKKGAISTAEYIDDIAKASVGSVGLGIGALLAHEGILSISTGNETVDKFNTKRGQQNLALKVGNQYINIGDLAPAAMPLVVGASVYDTVKNTREGGADAALDSILTGLGTISNTVTDMTMLSGLADILSSVRYSEKDSDIWLSLGEQVAGNLASQMLPTVGGKIEKTIDDTKRTTYTDKTGKLAMYVDQERRYLQTKLPGLQEAGEKMEQSEIPILQKAGDLLTLEPQIDGWGNEMKVQDYGIGGAGRVVNNFINPLTTTTDTSDRLDDELRELYKASGNNEDVLKFGTTSTSEAKIDDQKMTDKQWTQYQKDHGSMKHDLGTALIDSEYYKNADNPSQDKAELIKSLGDFSKAYNQNKITGKEMSTTNKGLAEIYDRAGGGAKGAQAVVDELTIKKKSSESGYASNTNAAKEIQKDLASGNTEAAQEKIDAGQKLPSLGLDKPGPAYTYYNAKEQIPNLTVEEFAETYKSIDADKNQGIKQGEIIDYLNKNKITSESEAKKLWSAYGNSEWAYIPKLENGTWTKKKK